jgi:chromosome partitioning protein
MVIVPICTDIFSLEGAISVDKAISQTFKYISRKPPVVRHLITKYDRRMNICQTAKAAIENTYKNSLFKSVIPQNVKLLEAPARGLPVYLVDPKSPGATAYADLADEVMS